MRIYHKPLVRWIWLGALLMMLGGFIAATERRLRQAVPAREGEAANPDVLPAAARTASEPA